MTRDKDVIIGIYVGPYQELEDSNYSGGKIVRPPLGAWYCDESFKLNSRLCWYDDAGGIPAKIGSLSQLKELHLSSNELKGEWARIACGRMIVMVPDKNVTLRKDASVELR